MTRVVVCGICGRMGTMVARALQSSADHEIAGGVELSGHECVGRRLSELVPGLLTDALVADDVNGYAAPDYDVIVDFSAPEQTAVCARKAADDGSGLVVGTTGLPETVEEAVRRASETAAVVLAPNTSVGVNVLFELARRASSLLGAEFDVDVVEAHHRFKKDAPSGTATRLVEVVAAARGLDPSRAARQGGAGLAGGRRSDEIGVHSIRAGQIVGRHELSFVAAFEEIKLVHHAFSREAFAEGAIRAARYVHGRAPGLYDMADVLGLRGNGGT